MWNAAALLLLALAGQASGLAFDTSVVEGALNLTSVWQGGFCGQLV